MTKQKTVAVLLLALAAVAVAPCCMSTGAPDWPAITAELQLVSQDLRDLAVVAESPELKADLIQLADALEHAPVNGDLIEGAIDIASKLLEDESPEVQVAALAAKMILRRVKVYAIQ